MKAYRVTDPGMNTTVWRKTLEQAKNKVNETEALFRSTIVVTECELPNDADGRIAHMNGDDSVVKEGRRWHGTRRGGLKELQ